MTFRERLEKDYPEKINPAFYGGCSHCPYTYGYETKPKCNFSKDTVKCTNCWNRVIPGTEFTKSDLKTGHIVTTRGGREFYVVKDMVSLYNNGDFLVDNTSRIPLDGYKDNLIWKLTDDRYDIVKVEIGSMCDLFQERKTIWKRKETKEISLEDAKRFLSKLYDKNVEITL
jgi:hypothetical protein